MTHWPKEDEEKKEVQKGKGGHGKEVKAMGDFTSGDLECGSGSRHPAKKSKFPIDDYLDPSIISPRDEMFPLPPLSPPPPSPSHKAMQNAKDLLQAAQQFLMNIDMDLKTGSRSLDRLTPSPEEGSYSSSGFSGQSNPLVVRKAVNMALGSNRSRTQCPSSPDEIKTLATSPLQKKTISVRKMKETNTLHKDIKCSQNATLKVTYPLDSSGKCFNQDLHLTRKSIDHSLGITQNVSTNMGQEQSPKSVVHQKRVTDSMCNIISKSSPHTSFYSRGGSMNYSESEGSDIVTADLSSPSSGLSSKCKLNTVLHGRKPPPNSPASTEQSHLRGETRAIRINKTCIVPRVLTGIQHNVSEREEKGAASSSRPTVDKGVGTNSNEGVKGMGTAAIDVGVNTSHSLINGAMVTLSGNLEESSEIGKAVSKQAVQFSLNNKNCQSDGPWPLNGAMATLSGNLGESSEIGKAVSKQAVRFSLNNKNCQSDGHQNDAKETNMPFTSPAAVIIPVSVETEIPPFQEEEVTGADAGTLNVNELPVPSSPPSIRANFAPINHEIQSVEEEEQIPEQQTITKSLMDNIARNVSYDELVEDITATRQLLSPKEMDTSAYFDGDSLTALIETILQNEFKKVAGEAQSPRSRMPDIRETPKDVTIPLNHSSRESEHTVDDVLEKEMKKIFLEEQDSTKEEMTDELERVYTPQASPSLVDPCDYEKEEDYMIVPTPSLSPPPESEDENKLEENILIEIKTPPATPKRSVENNNKQIQPNEEQDKEIDEKIPPTPRSQITDSILEEGSHIGEEIEPLSTPAITPSLTRISEEQLHSHSISVPSPEGQFETEDPLSNLSEKLTKTDIMPQKEVPCKAKDIEKPSPVTSKDSEKSHLKPIAPQVSEIRSSYLGHVKPPSKVMIESETQTDAEKNIYLRTPVPVELVQVEKYQDPDTTTSFTMDPEDEDASEADKSMCCLSEGEVKFKSATNVKVINMDRLSTGEVVSGRMAETGANFDVLASGILPTSLQAEFYHQNTETWSEGEIRNKWAVIHTSPSTASDGSKSFGEVNDRVPGSIPSEGEYQFSDHEK